MRVTLQPRVIVHADMDAFYAAIEQFDDPQLRGKPVLVGPPSARGVVLTASYEARPAGVGSAMPMALARRRCPDAIVVPPRFDRYREISGIVMRTFGDFSPEIEPISLDEAFLDMTGAEHVFGPPEAIGRKLKAAVAEATGGLTVSVGISATKYVAKVASGHAKPDGLTIVPEAEARTWLAPQPIAVLWGAGPKMQARLAALGLRTVGDIARLGPERLEAALGRTGRHFFELAEGRDPRPIEASRPARSMSSERTLKFNVRSPQQMRPYVRQAASAVARRLRDKAQTARGVRLKLKTHDFRVLTRQRQLGEATSASEIIDETARSLLLEIDDPGPFRLIGVAVYDLDAQAPAGVGGQLALLGERAAGEKLDAVVDALHAKFGPGTIQRASDLKSQTVFRDDINLDYLRGDSQPDEEA